MLNSFSYHQETHGSIAKSLFPPHICYKVLMKLAKESHPILRRLGIVFMEFYANTAKSQQENNDNFVKEQCFHIK